MTLGVYVKLHSRVKGSTKKQRVPRTAPAVRRACDMLPKRMSSSKTKVPGHAPDSEVAGRCQCLLARVSSCIYGLNFIPHLQVDLHHLMRVN